MAALGKVASVVAAFGLGAFSLAGLLAAAAASAELPPLQDQFGVVHGLNHQGDGLQIAIVVSAKRLRRLRPWERAIREYDEGLAVLRVADVPRTAANTTFEDVAKVFRKRLPEDLSVTIDLEGVWVEAYALDSSVPNVLVFDRGGQLLARHSGMFKKTLFQALADDLDRLLSESIGARSAPQSAPQSE